MAFRPRPKAIIAAWGRSRDRLDLPHLLGFSKLSAEDLRFVLHPAGSEDGRVGIDGLVPGLVPAARGTPGGSRWLVGPQVVWFAPEVLGRVLEHPCFAAGPTPLGWGLVLRSGVATKLLGGGMDALDPRLVCPFLEAYLHMLPVLRERFEAVGQRVGLPGAGAPPEEVHVRVDAAMFNSLVQVAEALNRVAPGGEPVLLASMGDGALRSQVFRIPAVKVYEVASRPEPAPRDQVWKDETYALQYLGLVHLRLIAT
jgi:hypothetical protein